MHLHRIDNDPRMIVQKALPTLDDLVLFGNPIYEDYDDIRATRVQVGVLISSREPNANNPTFRLVSRSKYARIDHSSRTSNHKA